MTDFPKLACQDEPLETGGLLALAAGAVQLRWVGPASAAFIVPNAASICFLSEPVPTNY